MMNYLDNEIKIIEQKKLEKVIKGLELCQNECLEPSNGKCPYYPETQGDRCFHVLLSDALALLKAQESRVMTLEEYDAWTNIPFTERDPVFHEERTKRGSVTCWVNTGVCSLREYGENDRCWTARPPKEKMEATPWNAQK